MIIEAGEYGFNWDDISFWHYHERGTPIVSCAVHLKSGKCICLTDRKDLEEFSRNIVLLRLGLEGKR